MSWNDPLGVGRIHFATMKRIPNYPWKKRMIGPSVQRPIFTQTGSQPMQIQRLNKYSSKPGEIKCMDRSLFTTRDLLVVTSCVFSDTVLTTGWIQLNNLQVGAADFNRVGNKVNNKSLQLTFVIFHADGTYASNSEVRYLIIYDKQPNGVAPVIGDVLSSIDDTGSETTNFCSHIKTANSSRFIVLRDKIVDVDSANSNIITCREFIKLKGMPSQYKGSTNPGVIANITQGALYFLCFTGQVTVPKIFAFNSRLKFYD